MNENTKTDVQVIENAGPDDVQAGDYVIWERIRRRIGVATMLERREGIAHHRDDYGDWYTENHAWLAGLDGNDATITIRRPVPVGQEPGR